MFFKLEDGWGGWLVRGGRGVQAELGFFPARLFRSSVCLGCIRRRLFVNILLVLQNLPSLALKQQFLCVVLCPDPLKFSSSGQFGSPAAEVALHPP